MKKVLIACFLAAIVLWFGYSFGYHRGIREERRAWEATATFDSDPAGRDRVCYRNPRAGVRLFSGPWMNAVNVPDPRVYKEYEHSSR
jgi:hypothetical protein